ncbi:hypothetical protein PKDLPJHF_02181 [Aeromonas veronii]
MEAQTLQQQVPVYHVCQQCNGAGCQACSDLLILDGDIQLDPEYVDPEGPPCDSCPQPCIVGESCRYFCSLSPINGVIGTSRETIPQRVARYNSGRNRLLAIKMQRASSLNPDLYCPRCFLSKASGDATCTRATCRGSI